MVILDILQNNHLSPLCLFRPILSVVAFSSFPSLSPGRNTLNIKYVPTNRHDVHDIHASVLLWLKVLPQYWHEYGLSPQPLRVYLCMYRICRNISHSSYSTNSSPPFRGVRLIYWMRCFPWTISRTSLVPRCSLVPTRRRVRVGTSRCLGTRDISRRGHIWSTWKLVEYCSFPRWGVQRTVKMWCHRHELSSWKLSSSSTLTTAIAYVCKGVLVRMRPNYWIFFGMLNFGGCDLYSGKYGMCACSLLS